MAVYIRNKIHAWKISIGYRLPIPSTHTEMARVSHVTSYRDGHPGMVMDAFIYKKSKTRLYGIIGDNNLFRMMNYPVQGHHLHLQSAAGRLEVGSSQ